MEWHPPAPILRAATGAFRARIVHAAKVASTMMMIGAAVMVAATCDLSDAQAQQTTQKNMTPRRSGKNWKHYVMSDVIATHQQSGRRYLNIVADDDMSLGVYELDVKDRDEQSPHGLDEVYYVLQGEAKIRIHLKDYDVSPGSIIFIKANVGHHFHKISDDLRVLVFFSKVDYSESAPRSLIFHADELRKERDNYKNFWESIISVKTMEVGFYMLPARLGGDEARTRYNKAVTIVLGGRATFRIGKERLNVADGSIVVLDAGAERQYENVTADTDVLILFVREPQK
jgi:quercetin dioxygenase-like cupin family protein